MYQINKMKIKKIVIASLLLFVSSTLIVDARGGGGGRSFSGSRSFSAPRTVSIPRATPKVSPTKIATPKVVPKTGTKVTPKTTKTVTRSVSTPKTKTVAGKTYSKAKTVTVGNQPRFSGGYVAPVGSTVYYPQSSALDWLPFYLIMTMNDGHREAVVSTPQATSSSGHIIPAQEKIVKEEGLDSMYIINWIITILFAGGIIGGGMYLINKQSKKKKEIYE